MPNKLEKRLRENAWDYSNDDDSSVAPVNPLVAADDALKHRRWCRDEIKLPASKALAIWKDK